jgi:hypothetical protein
MALSQARADEWSSGGAHSEAGTAQRNGERICGNQIEHCGTSFGLGGWTLSKVPGLCPPN